MASPPLDSEIIREAKGRHFEVVMILLIEDKVLYRGSLREIGKEDLMKYEKKYLTIVEITLNLSYNLFMILVMNKKHGVGCTTLTYNLGRLFDIPIYVKKDSFMLNPEHKHYFPTVSKITGTKKDGILDIGADYKIAYVKKLISNAKVIVIPLDFGYETIVDTIDTLNYLKERQREISASNASYLEAVGNSKKEKNSKLEHLEKCRQEKLKEITEANIEDRKEINAFFSEKKREVQEEYLNGVESLVGTRAFNTLHIPIVLVINRLDTKDSSRDFENKNELKLKLQNAGFSFDNDTLILTYLRNSYTLSSSLETGESFMNKIMSKQWNEDIDKIKCLAKKWRTQHTFVIQDNHFFNQNKVAYYNMSIEYRYFLDIANNIFSDVNYRNEENYDQEKDMVVFRNNFERNYQLYMDRVSYNDYYENKSYTKNMENKLIKDMAFVSFSIFKFLDIKEQKIDRKLFSFDLSEIEKLKKEISYETYNNNYIDSFH